MSTLTVLGDAAVHDLLINLSAPEIHAFQHELETTLKGFSQDEERKHQPDPSVVQRPDGLKTLFRPFTSPEAVGAKIVVDPSASAYTDNGKKPTLHGLVALMDKFGRPTGVLNAEEVTGYRTSLCALIPYTWRRRTDNVVVFGAGTQALWHIRLALGLRGKDIKSVTVVNRSKDRTETLLNQVRGENGARWKSPCTFTNLHHAHDNYEQCLAEALSDADAIFCTVPVYEPLFPAKHLLDRKDGSRLPYISAIGSWREDMIELDPEILRHAVETGHGGCVRDGKKGVVIADDRDNALLVSGEVIQSGLKGEDIVELGEVLERREKGEDLAEWLESGLVVYKVVGVSVTDLAAGNAILRMAKERGLGTEVGGF